MKTGNIIIIAVVVIVVGVVCTIVGYHKGRGSNKMEDYKVEVPVVVPVINDSILEVVSEQRDSITRLVDTVTGYTAVLNRLEYLLRTKTKQNEELKAINDTLINADVYDFIKKYESAGESNNYP